MRHPELRRGFREAWKEDTLKNTVGLLGNGGAAVKFMRRAWVKLWVNEWLDGTTRFQMSGAQRAFWIDLLALAGRSRYPGIICAGMDGDLFVGYPLKTFAALDAGAEIDLLATFDLFTKTGKITVEVTTEEPVKLYKVTICNWERYQSEYQRQKPYQETYRRKNKKLSKKLSLQKGSGYLSEEDGEEESEGKGEKEERQRKKSATPSPAAVTNAFFALGHKPFGPQRFQEIWAEEWSAAGEHPNWTDIMERAIQRCQRLGVTVPGLFFKHKHEIENGEVKMRYKV